MSLCFLYKFLTPPSIENKHWEIYSPCNPIYTSETGAIGWEELSHNLSLRYKILSTTRDIESWMKIYTFRKVFRCLCRGLAWAEKAIGLHPCLKYHNLLHVWTTRRVQSAPVPGPGARYRLRPDDWCCDALTPRSRRAQPAAGGAGKKRVHRLPLLEGATCSAQIGERWESFLIRRHAGLLAPWGPLSGIQGDSPLGGRGYVTTWWRGDEGNQAWPEMILSTLQGSATVIQSSTRLLFPLHSQVRYVETLWRKCTCWQSKLAGV